jgi:hypothetical protein
LSGERPRIVKRFAVTGDYDRGEFGVDVSHPKYQGVGTKLVLQVNERRVRIPAYIDGPVEYSTHQPLVVGIQNKVGGNVLSEK